MNLVVLTLLWICLCQASGLCRGPVCGPECGKSKGGVGMVTGGLEVKPPNKYPWTVSQCTGTDLKLN